MLEKILDFPTQVADAFTGTKSLELAADYDKITDIVVLGMGGSGIVGDFLHVLLRNSTVPLYVNKHILSPRFVSKNTLVLAVTYSGKTRETLDALWNCRKLGAKMIVVTSADELKSTCYEKKIPCVTTPKNGHSRASLGYMLAPLLYTLQKIGILQEVDNYITETVEIRNSIRDACSPESPLERNPARSLDLELLGRFPIIYGVCNFTDAVALRWKQMFNENSKIHCYCDAFPELLHNEIEAWEGDGYTHENYALILLRDSIYEQEIGLQGKIRETKYLVHQKGSKIFDVRSKGRSELARLLSLSYLGDLTSAYLAIAKGVDSSSVHNIDFMKKCEFGG